MNLSVKEFPDDVVKVLRLEAVNTDVTLREVIVRVLAEYTGVGAGNGGGEGARVKGRGRKEKKVAEAEGDDFKF